MSKMTVVQEGGGDEYVPDDSFSMISSMQGNKQYFDLKFAEFLEMMARAANIKFSRDDVVAYSLAEKVEFMLDELIPIV